MFDLTTQVEASEPDPIDDLTEWVEDSDVVVIGTISSVTLETLGQSTPEPVDAPSMVTTVERITVTVQPDDGSQPVDIFYYREYLTASEADSRASKQPIAFPRDVMAFALDVNYDGDAFQCTTYAAQWCGLTYLDGMWVSAESVADGDPWAVPGPPGVVHESIHDGAEELLSDTQTPVSGVEVASSTSDANALLKRRR